jgi:hypothetical protein
MLGLLANLIELGLALPIFLQVVIYHNVTTVSAVLVTQYALGDVTRLIMFCFLDTPWVFVLGASISLAVTTVAGLNFLILTLQNKQSLPVNSVVQESQSLLGQMSLADCFDAPGGRDQNRANSWLESKTSEVDSGFE